MDKNSESDKPVKFYCYGNPNLVDISGDDLVIMYLSGDRPLGTNL